MERRYGAGLVQGARAREKEFWGSVITEKLYTDVKQSFFFFFFFFKKKRGVVK